MRSQRYIVIPSPRTRRRRGSLVGSPSPNHEWGIQPSGNHHEVEGYMSACASCTGSTRPSETPATSFPYPSACIHVLPFLYPFSDPPHNGNGHAVSESFVARTVGSRFSFVGDKRVIVRETEKAFPLFGRGYSDACFFQYIRRSVIVSSRPSSRETREHMPRFPSLRSIPAQALGLKKYRDGRPPVSKISDKEDSTATLGNSEELSVQDSVGKMIPAFSQRLGKVTEVDPAVR